VDTVVTYTIYPRKHAGVKIIQKSALEDILDILKAILGDHMHGSEIKKDCVLVSADASFMEGVIRRSNLRDSCRIEKKGLIFNG